MAPHVCSGHLGILLKRRRGLSMFGVGPGILRVLQLPAGAWVVQLRGDQATEARKLSPGEPVLKPKRRHSKRVKRVGGRGQGGVPELGLAVRGGQGRGLQQAGWALLVLMKFGHEGQRGMSCSLETARGVGVKEPCGHGSRPP